MQRPLAIMRLRSYNPPTLLTITNQIISQSHPHIINTKPQPLQALFIKRPKIGRRLVTISGYTSRSRPLSATLTPSASPLDSDVASDKAEAFEEQIEKVIYRCRFLALLGVFGSLIGSFLCFIKGSTYVVQSFSEYVVNHGKVILRLVEATVMLVFGMGLYELFVSNLGTSNSLSHEKAPYRSNLFGLFTLKGRPKWLEIKTVNELKTKLGHVIVMLLLIGLFDKSKKAAINSPLDLLCFSASILLSSGCLFLLSKLHD